MCDLDPSINLMSSSILKKSSNFILTSIWSGRERGDASTHTVMSTKLHDIGDSKEASRTTRVSLFYKNEEHKFRKPAEWNMHTLASV